jgi:hypothetical protein
MAKFDLTNVREALDNVVVAVKGLYDGIVEEANQERLELLALYGRMRDTQYHLNTLNGFARQTAESLVGIADDGTAISMAIEDVMGGGVEAVHLASYSNFAGFCEICGGEMTFDGETVKFGDGRAHVECFDFEDEDEEECDAEDEEFDAEDETEAETEACDVEEDAEGGDCDNCPIQEICNKTAEQTA